MMAANGGVTTHIVDLSRYLLLNKCKVVLVSDGDKCEYWKQIHDLERLGNFRFCSVGMDGINNNPIRMIKSAEEIRKIAVTEQIDIIHTHSQSICVLAAWIKLRNHIPYIWTNHIDAIANPKVFRVILHILKFPIISVSSDLKNLLIKQYGVSEDRITVINNGTDLKRFSPLTQKEKTELKNKFNCNGKYTIGLLARITPVKGHMIMLQAINKIMKEEDVNSLKILIAGKVYDGDEEYLSKVTTYANEHGIDVEFLGFQNPREIFGICDISLLPSIYEGFPLTVLESLAMGCPVIRSNTPGWMDTEDIAKVFEKENIDQLAELILYAYRNQDEMRRLGEYGKRVVEQKFTIQRQIEKTMRVYEFYKR